MPKDTLQDPPAAVVAGSVWTEFGLAGCAAVGAIACTNPLDVVKTRLQLQSERPGARPYTGVGQALVAMARREGVRGLQRGLAAASLLQFTNVATRFGVYGAGKRFSPSQTGSAAPEMAMQHMGHIALGGVAGAAAAVVSNPFFLLKTRFQSSAGLAELATGHQHHYASLRAAIGDVWRHGGLRGFYKGLGAFIPRVMVASGVQLSTYDLSKEMLQTRLAMRDGVLCHLGASFLTGIAVVLAMQPFDFAATRLMNQPTGANGRGLLYRGTWHVLSTTLRKEGIRGIYQGSLASYLRFGPYCVLVFSFLEQLRGLDRLMARRAER